VTRGGPSTSSGTYRSRPGGFQPRVPASRSFDVSFEGKGAARSFDLMLHNDKNTPPFPVLQGPVVAMGKGCDKVRCLVCDEEL
jgi:hypothetical protein